MHDTIISRLIDEESALPFIVDTSDAMELDQDFAFLVCKAQKAFDAPVVIETSAANFEVLVPQSLQSCPMWVCWLPESFSEEIGEFTTFKTPRVWDITSVDLLKRRVTIEWESIAHCISINAVNVEASLNWAYSNGGQIVVAFVTPSRMAVTTMRVDEDLMLDLLIRGQHCDHNYRPQREHSKEELEAAAARSVIEGNEPARHTFGPALVHPVGKRYLYCQS